MQLPPNSALGRLVDLRPTESCPIGSEEMLPGSPLSRNQVELIEIDTGDAGFDALGIAPQPIEHALEQILARR